MATPQLKQVIVIDSASTTAAATATGVVDTLGFDWMTVDLTLSTSDSTSNNPSTIAWTECDTNAYSSSSAITALTGDGVGGFTIPAATTATVWGMKFNLNLGSRKRYMFLAVAPTTTQVVTAIANLGRAEVAPVNTTKANVKALVEL